MPVSARAQPSRAGPPAADGQSAQAIIAQATQAIAVVTITANFLMETFREFF
jgi:hypothetical protein